MAPVAALLAMDRTTLTAALKPLQRRGLVEVTADPADKRGRLLRLTQEGRALLREAVPIWEATHGAVSHDLATLPARRPRLSSVVPRLR
jgi:DNA-binding MarR family transcriptional regulator